MPAPTAYGPVADKVYPIRTGFACARARVFSRGTVAAPAAVVLRNSRLRIVMSVGLLASGRCARSGCDRFAEIRLQDPRVARDRRGRALTDDLPVVQDDEPLRRLHDGLHHVLDPEQAHAALVADAPQDGGRARAL